jgi:glycosyltransferase involved in cell wall biosynthesis
MLVDLYPPNIGGVERAVQSLSVLLRREGHQVTVCTLGHPSSVQYDHGVRVYREEGLFQKIPFLYGGSKKRWHPPAPDWLLSRKIAKIIEQEKPDIIHAHGWIIYSVLPLKEKYGIPLVSTLHGYGYFCSITNLIRNNAICYERSFHNCIRCAGRDYGYFRSLAAYYGINRQIKRLKLVDKFIAVSPFVKEAYLTHLPLRNEDIEVVPNYYSPAIIEEEGIIANLPEDFILFVGALAPYKGLDVLIQAYNQLNTSTKLVVMGYRYLRYQYANTGNILVVEDVPHDMVMQAMSKCKFVVFPSIFPEPSAIVGLEAMSERKAVIASNIAGFKDYIVNGKTGILVSAGDPGELAEAIDYLLRKPELAVEMGQNGYDRLNENYIPEVIVPKIIKVYNSLISSNIARGSFRPN